MTRFFVLALATVLGSGPALAQRNAVGITPRITGGDSANGRCIVRIMVDDVVNVRIGNGRILVQTLQGRDSRDDGSECSSMLQNGRNLSDFRFRGIDGRGEVRLQSDPRQDPRGEAVIYIRDSKGGDEGYTFEVSWQGDSGNGPLNRGNGNRGNGNGRGGFFGGNNNNDSYNRAVNSCTDSVRTQVQRDYNVNNLSFDDMNSDNNQGRRDRISGTARGSGRRADVYRFDCDVNLNNGTVRNVNVRRN